ncbi:helix-turn-helix transcriptional regulator [Ochrobactrum sp. AN78]|uniref:helix-turn-helix domain-containing protein n=1 Tax=Ochrobactrum sp. AN78 TaxID=3039853 RepID=UPI002989F619|nr:helix-turn-helix transcriptional regulator [Ochrobactrum sp. AN78]MDH7790705.1 transcriptional regulator with XRE-family HTH domain [Ochrobactrum sp. AN78]
MVFERKSKNTTMVFVYNTVSAYHPEMNEIRRLREEKGLSQAQLAEMAGTSQPQIKRLEDGARKLTKEWAERLAPHLSISAETLLFPDSKEIPEDQKWNEFNELFFQVGEDDQEVVLRLMRSLAAAKKE